MKPSEPVLTLRALNRALLARQFLMPGHLPLTLMDAVSRLIAIQAQQPRPAFAALFTRGALTTADAAAKLIAARKLVRATTMRTTLHLMTAADYQAFRGCLQPALTASAKSILADRAAGLDVPALLEAARASFAPAPQCFTQLRTDLSSVFEGCDERALAYTVRTHLPLIAVPGESRWSWPADPAFTPAESWLGKPHDMADRTAQLVTRYLEAYGPATPADFQAWSGLRGIAPIFKALRPKLRIFRDERNRELFDVPGAPLPDESEPAPVRFLAEFDNIILAHADRSRIIADQYRPKVVTKNLLVLGTFLVDGFVAGTWKAVRVREAATLEIAPFRKLTSVVQKQVALQAEPLIKFMESDAKRYRVTFK